MCTAEFDATELHLYSAQCVYCRYFMLRYGTQDDTPFLRCMTRVCRAFAKYLPTRTTTTDGGQPGEERINEQPT